MLELLLPTRLFRLGFGGAWQLAVATLVILLEVFSRFVFFVVPGPIMSFLDWERSKVGFAPVRLLLSFLHPPRPQSNPKSTISISNSQAFLPGVRLFRGVNDEPEDATMEVIDASALTQHAKSHRPWPHRPLRFASFSRWTLAS